MLKVLTVSILGLVLAACGSSSSGSNENQISNSDQEPNNSIENAQILARTTQADQNDLEVDRLQINLEGSLDFQGDPVDFYSLDVPNESGKYILGVGWNSNIENDSINNFNLLIYKNGQLVEDIEANGNEQSSAGLCLDVVAGDKYIFEITTENDSGKYGFMFGYYPHDLSCNEYNNSITPSTTPLNYVYKVDGLGTGVCIEEAFEDTVLANGVVNNLGFSYGKCMDALGVDTYAYCLIPNNGQSWLESRYYFEISIESTQAQFMCNGWNGDYVAL